MQPLNNGTTDAAASPASLLSPIALRGLSFHPAEGFPTAERHLAILILMTSVFTTLCINFMPGYGLRQVARRMRKTSSKSINDAAWITGLAVYYLVGLIVRHAVAFSFHVPPAFAIFYLVIPTWIYLIFPFVVMIWRSQTYQEALLAIPTRWLFSVQLARAIGYSFNFAMDIGRVPVMFAIPAGWGDILEAFLAGIALLLIDLYSVGNATDPMAVEKSPQWRKLRWYFLVTDAWGIIDFILAFTTALISLADFLAASNLDLRWTDFFWLIPGWNVPIFLIFEIISLYKLYKTWNGYSDGDSKLEKAKNENDGIDRA